MRREIKLYTRPTIDGDMSLVHTLDREKNLSIYLMVENNNGPEVLVWGERTFIKNLSISPYIYTEGFALPVFE